MEDEIVEGIKNLKLDSNDNNNNNSDNENKNINSNNNISKDKDFDDETIKIDEEIKKQEDKKSKPVVPPTSNKIEELDIPIKTKRILHNSDF